MTEPTRAELEAAHCWEAEDGIGGAVLAAFRRRARLDQAHWRDGHGHPIGTQPIAPKPGQPARPVGSRLPLGYARESGANFITAAAREAATRRCAVVERHQTLDHQRLWADLLWSPSLAFNLFGDLAADPTRADRAVHAWFPDAPGTVGDVRFVHSPGRFDPSYLNSLRAFDAVFVLDIPDGTQGIVAVDVKYHERIHSETPRPDNVPRYLDVAEQSGAFRAEATRLAGRSDLCEIWLEHLLLLSMLQHGSGAWTWGRYLVVHASENVNVVDMCARYRDELVDTTTFSTMTLEELLDSGTLPAATTHAVRDRYLPATLPSK